MGSQKIQASLWGRQTADWASIQEATAEPGYEYAMQFVKTITPGKLLDIGCGSGLFCHLAYSKGMHVTGMDASEQMIEQAKKRNPSIDFLTGEMEELPFADNSFDIVCGFNSFQYAANTAAALNEAKRVLKPGGKLIAMVWGNKEDCEAASFLKAVGSLLPPPPPGAPGPFALSENRLLEKILEESGFTIIDNNDVPAVWDYPETGIALKGLMSTGPVAKAIDQNGFDKVYETISDAVKPYIKANGHVVYDNKFRVVTAVK